MSAEPGDQETGPFPFPFQPYDVQSQLMHRIFETLDTTGVGIFESPTGTGKSLSVICSALHWLKTAEGKDTRTTPEAETRQEQAPSALGGALPGWLTSFQASKEQGAAEAKALATKLGREKFEGLLGSLRQESLDLLRVGRGAKAAGWGDKREDSKKRREKPKGKGKEAEMDASDDERWLVSDYTSDGEAAGSDDSDGEEDDPFAEDTKLLEDLAVRQVFYCSRTHSQISQFVNEVKKTAFGDGIRCVSLGSRRNLCINKEVMKRGRGSDARVTDLCLDLQKGKATSPSQAGVSKKRRLTEQKAPKKKTQTRCPYLSGSSQKTFRNHSLAVVRDIEELARLGDKLESCPYYGTRAAVPFAQLVVMPYTVLLHKQSRESMGLKLKGAVVIIDEAHNLIETINSIHSVKLNLAELARAHKQLSQYRDRYGLRLKGKNNFYVGTLLQVLWALMSMLRKGQKDADKITQGGKQAQQQQAPRSTVMKVNDFLFNAKVDNVNLFKLQRFMRVSNISRKIMGFMESDTAAVVSGKEEAEVQPGQQDGDGKDVSVAYVSSHVSSLDGVGRFLSALGNPAKDGRIIVSFGTSKGGASTEDNDATLKYVMLNPAVHFDDIVEQARSVVLVGGTMQPIDDFVVQLFSNVDEGRISSYTCGHVIPPDHLLPLAITHGPTRTRFNFSYHKRCSDAQLDELGRLLLNVCTMVPGGVVVFVASYTYLDTIVARWQSSGLLSQIGTRKAVFCEPRLAKNVESVLSQYTAAVEGRSGGPIGKGGGLLLSVVGGKMSEGINFSDALARLVVMVGLPYPDKRDVELAEKMAYLDAKSANGKAGQAYYQGLCMRAVNQSIGRSIRHIGDYASIMLVDERYEDAAVISRLPQWIAERVTRPATFGEAIGALRRFFAAMAEAETERAPSSTCEPAATSCCG